MIIHNLNGERDLRYTVKYFSGSLNRKFIYTFHKPRKILKDILLNNANLKKIDGIIALGSKQKEFLINKLKHNRVKLIHHGIDTNYFTPKNNFIKSNIKRSILFVGQHLRDFEMFNNVINIFKNENIDINVNVVIQPAYLRFLKNKDYLKIYSNISEDKLKVLYQNAICLFLPFKDVTACNAILESLACGTPIITNNVGDNSDYLDSSCAIFAENKESFVDSIQSLIMNSDKKNMRVAARNKSLKFDWENISRKVKKFYEEVSS